MSETITYLLKANLSLVLFYLGYRLLLRKLTFYQLNRFYLLFGLVFSATYPVVDITGWMAAQQPFVAEVVYVVPNWQQIPVAEFDWWLPVMALFWLGVAYFGIQLLIRLLSLWQIHRASRPATWRLFRYRQVFANVNPFTFWRSIYLNIQQHEEAELAAIFSHEQIHANELHTIDVLVAELSRVLCWFNPGAWLMRHAIHENLEYLTDRNVLQSGVDKKTYQYRLLKVGQYAGRYPQVTNHFNFKSLKRRIAMMNRKRSSALQLGNYVFAIPVIAVLVLAFTVTRAYQDDGAEIANQLNLAVSAEVQRPVSIDTNTRKEVEQEVELQPELEQPNEVSVQPSATRDSSQSKVITLEAESGITIRRSDSAHAAVPLFVVDGFPMKDDGFLEEIKPEDIARVSVWKDERLATSLYGKAAENGLIVITTKAAPPSTAMAAPEYRLDTMTNTGAGRLLAVVGNRRGNPTIQTDQHRDAVSLTGRPPLSQEKFASIFRPSKPDFNGALIIIDGKESTAAALRALSPDKIESINVLKGEAATKAHGQKGAKGAIEVITER